MMIREAFETDGYVVVRGVASPSSLAAIRNRYLPHFLSDDKRHSVDDVAVCDAELRSFVAEGPLRGALAEVLGEQFVVYAPTSVDYNRYTNFHRDTTGIESDGFRGHRSPDFLQVTVGIYLQQHPVGGLDVVPRTQFYDVDEFIALRAKKHALRAKVNSSPIRKLAHRLSNGRLYNTERDFASCEGTVTPRFQLGDAIIFNVKMIHAGNQQRIADGHKLAIFYRCGRLNGVTETYAEHYAARNAYVRGHGRMQAVANLNRHHSGVQFR